MKKIITSVLIIMCVLMLSGCGVKPHEDALKFKEEYESLNGKKNANGLEHRTVTIDEFNPYRYITGEEVIEKIENKETFYLYVGDKQCPWCRSVIEKSIEEAKENKIDEIFYIGIWDDDHNEIFRDKFELNKKGKPVKTIEGTEAYAKLLEYFDPVLKEYTLTNEKGKTVKTGEKRIFAPNYFYVKDGKIAGFVSGIPEGQEDSRQKLTDEMLEDEEEQFKNFFTNK